MSSNGLEAGTNCSPDLITDGLIRARQAVRNAGRRGVVISRVKAGLCCVRRKILVIVVRYSFLISGASDLPKQVTRLRAQGSEPARRVAPAVSTMVLMKIAADNLPDWDLSCKSALTRVFSLCVVTETVLVFESEK